MQHMLRRTHTRTHKLTKLKVNIVHAGVAWLLFISYLTKVHVCIRLVVNNESYTEFHPYLRQRGFPH